ncbi:MAG: aminotransferase class I/II-fold pyridoxal phosphate-dependent enzyme [Bacteroidales bacterium]|nr:aminotransferase class I/II-fold pyridoxal phosphate-dependent enzyme [Bacteroidales bacterium]
MNHSEIINLLGEEHEKYFQSIAPPLIQTSNFCYPTVSKMRSALQKEFDTPVYSRGNNPTTGILRKKLAALEHTEDCLVFASGCAAISSAVISNVHAGDHVICVENPYSWTNHLLSSILPGFKVQTTFIDGSKIENFQNALQKNTRLIYLETPKSWTFELQDLQAVADLAKRNKIITVADNSYCTPLYQNPADFGIDLVVHSASKYLSGHSDVVAGVVCSNKKMIRKIFKNEYMTFGAIISPFDAWLILRGLRTLQIRLERSSQTAQKIIEGLKSHPKIEQVIYPFDSGFPQLKLANRQMKNASGLFSIHLKTGNAQKVEKFCESLKYFRLAVSWGGHESLVFPAIATELKVSDIKSNLPVNMVRLYTGLEDAEELSDDLNQALEKI